MKIELLLSFPLQTVSYDAGNIKNKYDETGHLREVITTFPEAYEQSVPPRAVDYIKNQNNWHGNL